MQTDISSKNLQARAETAPSCQGVLFCSITFNDRCSHVIFSVQLSFMYDTCEHAAPNSIMPLDLSSVPNAYQSYALPPQSNLQTQRRKNVLSPQSQLLQAVQPNLSSTVRSTSELELLSFWCVCVCRPANRQHGNSFHCKIFLETRNCSHQRPCVQSNPKHATL